MIEFIYFFCDEQSEAQMKENGWETWMFFFQKKKEKGLACCVRYHVHVSPFGQQHGAILSVQEAIQAL